MVRVIHIVRARPNAPQMVKNNVDTAIFVRLIDAILYRQSFPSMAHPFIHIIEQFVFDSFAESQVSGLMMARETGLAKLSPLEKQALGIFNLPTLPPETSGFPSGFNPGPGENPGSGIL